MVKRASLAHCRVKYRTKAGVEETVWNSTLMNTPMELLEQTTGDVADLVDGPRDYRPDYVPELGERIFVVMDEAAMRRYAERVIDDPKMPKPVSEDLTNNFATRAEAVEYVVGMLRDVECLDTVYVTSAIQEQIKRQRALSARPGVEIDSERSASNAAALMTAMLFSEDVRARVRSTVKGIVFYDRDGKRITPQEFLELRKNERYHLLADTHITHGFHVQTVWLGIGRERGRESCVFETVFMRQKNVGDAQLTRFVQRSYATEADAFRGHAALVREARDLVQDQLE